MVQISFLHQLFQITRVLALSRQSIWFKILIKLTVLLISIFLPRICQTLFPNWGGKYVILTFLFVYTGIVVVFGSLRSIQFIDNSIDWCLDSSLSRVVNYSFRNTFQSHALMLETSLSNKFKEYSMLEKNCDMIAKKFNVPKEIINLMSEYIIDDELKPLYEEDKVLKGLMDIFGCSKETINNGQERIVVEVLEFLFGNFEGPSKYKFVMNSL